MKTQSDSPVRRFATMVANTYEFPVIIGVVAPEAPNMLGRYKLNNLLNRWRGVKIRSKTWIEHLAAPLLHWLYVVDPTQEPQNQGQAYTPEQMNHEYIKLLWQAAQKHPQGKKIPSP